MGRFGLPLTVATVAVVAGGAAAQIQTLNARVGYTLAWEDDGNHNGLLEPGESAVVRLTITVTPAINSEIQYTQNNLPLMGTLRGFGSGFINIDGSNLLGGTLTPGPVAPAFGGWDPPSVVGGSIRNLQIGQFPPSN